MATKTNSNNKNGKSETGKVKPASEAAENLRELFEEQLKDIYWAEKALTKALPKMAKNASAEELVDALNEHLAVTEEQVSRLEEVFGLLNKKPQAKKCEAMEGLLKEGQSIMEDTEPGAVRDAGIIGACQKVEHYEIASYGTLAAFANLLEEPEVAELLQQTLAEEKDADETLTDIAMTSINLDAEEEEEEESKNGKTKNGSKSKRVKAMA